MTERPPGGSVRSTPPRALAVAALFGALAGWLVVVASDALGMVAPRVPWTAPIGLLLTTVLVGALAYTTHQRIQVRKERVDPSRAVSFLVLGKASALAGAVVAGGYMLFGLLFLGRIDADAPRERVIRAGVAVIAGLMLMVSGLLLERACKVRGGDDEGDEDSLESDTDR